MEVILWFIVASFVIGGALTLAGIAFLIVVLVAEFVGFMVREIKEGYRYGRGQKTGP